MLGLLATGLGSAMATHLFVRRVDDVGFDRGTEWARAVSIGWWLLAVVLVVLAFQISGGGVTRGSAQAADVAAAGTDSLTAELIGAAALLGVLGPGYSAYRTALAEAPPRTPTTS